MMSLEEELRTLLRELDSLREIKSLYSELIMAVEDKYKNETRHQTALKLLQNYNLHEKTKGE